jgi:transcriptional regulator with XRE-family HTH domain
MAADPQKNNLPDHDIGKRLRYFRKSRAFSIRLLAEKASLSPNTISLIESNSTSPTVGTLQTIANVLDIPLAAFFVEPNQEEEIILVNELAQKKEVTPGIKVSVYPRQVLDNRIQVMHFSVEPGGSSGSDPLVHPGDELVLCFEGEIDYIVNERVFKLKREDSLGFKGNLPHSWVNNSQSEAHFLVLITTEYDQSYRSHIFPAG